MNKSLARAFVAAASLAPFYPVFDSKARAAEWGCQVILCLSNPGGPTQYAECRPPIQKLWSELAKGHSFPTCSGVGFHSSRPGYEPYYCDAGYRLSGSYGLRGQEATCVSTSLQHVSSSLCSYDRDNHGRANSVLSPRWQREGGRLQCVGYPIARPNRRPQSHYVDVIIDGVGQQRVWY